MKTIIDANDDAARAKPGYILFVYHCPGAYVPCPSVFYQPGRGETPWAAHFTALYEAVQYVDEMKRARLIGDDSMLFIRNQDDRIVWKNKAKVAQEARYLAGLYEGDRA